MKLLIDEYKGTIKIIATNGTESEYTNYTGVAVLGNYFAVTDYYKGVFPTYKLLKFEVIE